MLSPRNDNSGVTGALPYDPIQYTILSACTAVAWLFALELIATIVFTSNGRTGCYFWSLLISSAGCIVHALGFVLKFLVGTSWVADLTFIGIGWVAMVSGQSFVLWSRLNLVIRSRTILNGVLAAIIVNGMALHTPTLVFIYGANSPAPKWVHRFNTMERIQLLGFSIQEAVIGGIYIFATAKLLGAIYYGGTRRAMLQLLAIMCICLAMDIVLIALEFSGYYVTEASVKPLIYAIKLKLEFAVYRQLVGFTKAAFEDNETIECMEPSVDYPPRRQYNSPVEFFKNIPNVLKKPAPAPAYPTIHTHPEQVLRADRAMGMEKIGSGWDLSSLELSPNNVAAALTASGGCGATIIPRNTRSISIQSPVNPVGPKAKGRPINSDSDMGSDFGCTYSESGIQIRQSHD